MTLCKWVIFLPVGIRGVSAVVVYGVGYPEQDGKCGMAAFAMNENADLSDAGIDSFLSELHEKASSGLPAYARPYFIRVLNQLAMTGTYKFQKNTLSTDGYDPSKTKGDRTFYCSWKPGSKFVPITQSFYDDFTATSVKL